MLLHEEPSCLYTFAGHSDDSPVQYSAMSHCPLELLHVVPACLNRHVLVQHSPLVHCAPVAILHVLALQHGSSHSYVLQIDKLMQMSLVLHVLLLTSGLPQSQTSSPSLIPLPHTGCPTVVEGSFRRHLPRLLLLLENAL